MLLAFSTTLMADDADIDENIHFNIPQQRADLALTQFAKQADLTLVFPFDDVRDRTAKRLVGEYPIKDAVEILLSGTGLTPTFRNQLVLNIATDNKSELEGKEMNVKKNAGLGAFFASIFVASGAAGQEGSSTSSEFQIDEIVVTASRRETSLQNTPLSVSSISGADLGRRGITRFDQILGTVPGATVIDFGPGGSGVSFRGLATSGILASFRAASTIYLDEFPLDFRGGDIKLVDMKQIEVLKGPQGTLYGKSAMGGVMRYITNKPNFDAIAGGVDLSFESVESGGTGYQAQGYINIPLSENLAVRAVLYDYDSAGFIDNLGTNTKNVNTHEVTGGRLALGWDISDRVEFDLLYLNQDSRLNCCQANGGQTATATYSPVQNGPPTDLLPPDLENPSFRSIFDPTDDKIFKLLNLKLDIEFEHFDLSVMGATKDVINEMNAEGSIWFGIYDDVTATHLRSRSDTETKTFEGRLVSTGDGPIEWIAGVWYEDVDGHFIQAWPIETPRTDLTLFGFLPIVSGDFLFDQEARNNAEELAVYGEVGYKFTDKAKLTLGYRRADLELDSTLLKADGLVDAFFGIPLNIGLDERVQEDIDTYKIHFEYKFDDDILAWALASSGYRAGGFNRGGRVTATSRFETDSLWNYEVGVRTSWLDNRLTANAVVYYLDWSDIQYAAWDQDALSFRIQNLVAAENFGLETEIRYRATEHLHLSANYSYIDATLAEDVLDTAATPPTVQAAKGVTLPGSSKHAFSLLADWQRPLTSTLDLLAYASYRYIGSRPNNLGEIPGALAGFPDVPSAQFVDLSVGVRHDSGVTVTLFANNLFDERSIQVHIISGTVLDALAMSRPRTIGLNVGYAF